MIIKRYYKYISIKNKTEKRRKNSIGTGWDGGTAGDGKNASKKKFWNLEFKTRVAEN